MENAKRKRRYNPPVLTQYGRLASLTGQIPCSGWVNKIGSSYDDYTGQTQLGGDPTCVS